MQNLTSLTQSSAGNITCAKALTVTGTATFNGAVDLTGATVTGMTLTASVVAPDADDGAALGSTSLKWSDLFLASGGVINFNSGNVTLTHSAGTLTMNNLLTLSGNTGINFTGTAITKGINFASAVAAMSDADDAFISIGTWNDAVVVGTQTAHFVPIQVHLHSAVSAAYDIAAARFRVDTSAANTANALGCLQLRQAIAHNVASSAILNASVSVDGAVAVQTGSLLGGYFSIEGTGAITKAGSNDCTPLVAVNNNTGGGVDNVFIAMQNGNGTTVTEIVKVVAVHGTATVGLYIDADGGTVTSDIKLQSGSTIVDSGHFALKSGTDTKTITLNSRTYAATSGDIIGFQAKPAANATGTCTVYGGQISPRANDDVDVAALVGLQVEPILKGATVLAVRGDMRGMDVRLTSEGANTVGGKAGCYFAYNLLKSATFTGGVYPFVVTAAGDTQAWTALMEIPTELSGSEEGGGAAVYIPITINGTAARIAAKYVS
jgi:hypothetical protein